MARDHRYHHRKQKLCIKCSKNDNMASSSYCAECHRAYDKERKSNDPSQQPESEIVNKLIHHDESPPKSSRK